MSRLSSIHWTKIWALSKHIYNVARGPKPYNSIFDSFQEKPKNESNDVTKFIKSKPHISIYCAKIPFNSITYMSEGHDLSYFTISNQHICNKHRDSPSIFPQKCDLQGFAYKRCQHTGFILLIIIWPDEDFYRMCALAGTISKPNKTQVSEKVDNIIKTIF